MHLEFREPRRFTEITMSLTIGPNVHSYAGTSSSRQAEAAGRDPNASRQAPGGGEDQQTGRSQVSDQIDITSITINISQTITTPGSDQLQVGVVKAAPLGSGQPAQLLGEGYFSSPTNFVPVGSGSAGSSSTTEANITLQILSETATTSAQAEGQSGHAKGQHSSAREDAGGNSKGSSTPENSAHQPVDISI
jgi:hypothetical protein